MSRRHCLNDKFLLSQICLIGLGNLFILSAFCSVVLFGSQFRLGKKSEMMVSVSSWCS